MNDLRCLPEYDRVREVGSFLIQYGKSMSFMEVELWLINLSHIHYSFVTYFSFRISIVAYIFSVIYSVWSKLKLTIENVIE